MTLRNACLIALAAASLAAAQVPITQVPIVDAARDGDREAVRALIAQHADVNATEADGMTALHWAVRADDMETAQLLLKAGANVKAGNRYGVTPLSLAATNGSAPMIQALLKAGADPNAVRDSGETVLMTAAHSGNADAVRALLARDANPNAKEKSLGETALMWAAQENHPEAIKALVEYGADKNAHGSVLTIAPFKWSTSGMVSTVLPRGGWTPLMYAARQGSLEAARALADSGADLNAKDPDGTTALVFAIINAHFDVAAMLLDKGADPNVADDTGMAALYAAVDMHTLGKMLSRPSPKLVDSIDAADLVKLLLDHKADPNARLLKPMLGRHHNSGDATMGEGTTALMRAAKTNDLPVMKMLLAAGADPFLTQADYTNVVMIIAAGGARGGQYAVAFAVNDEDSIESMKLCLASGADLNAFNIKGQTVVHLAAGRGADKLVRFLAENGAKLDMKDRQGYTPLDIAEGKDAGTRGQAGVRQVGQVQVSHPTTAALLRQYLNKSGAQNTAQNTASAK